MKYFTLKQLNQSIQKLINGINREFWISAEIAQVNLGYHAYLELVQKEGEQIIAKSRANIWNMYLSGLRHKLGDQLDTLLQVGTKVLLKVSVSFHEVHGLSLAIIDLDPSYTLGELEQKRLQTIKQLEEEGLIGLQQALPLPLVLQKIAVISSAEAAGYSDFISQLAKNPYGYQYHTKLFPASVQGLRATREILAQLGKIASLPRGTFDALVIIRGGGSKLDLEAFNSYEVAAFIAQMEIPVLTGIGHQRDISVCDLVAHLPLKTPTAVAEQIIQQSLHFESRVQNSWQQINLLAERQLRASERRLKELGYRLLQTPQRRLQEEQMKLSNKQLQLNYISKRLLDDARNKLQYLEKKVELSNPLLLLQKGYTITYQQGKPLKPNSKIAVDEQITTLTASQTIESLVIEVGANSL